LQSQEVVIAPLELIEKEEIIPVLHPPANPVIIRPSTNNLSLMEVSPSDELTPLEIKPVAEEAVVLDAVSAVLASPKYDPIADLKNYKYPSLDLLAHLSGEKIVMDQHELEANKNQIMSTLRNYDIEIQKIFATETIFPLRSSPDWD
jgi:S-DNA-T family DNA segregation ATPase FtsK/SpoIIIE